MQAATNEHFTNTDEIREYIYEMLCSRDNLQPGSFAISERPLTRRGETCAIFFCLHGPRLLRLTAIWDTQAGAILFYGSRGERFLKTEVAPLAVLAA
ncbi:MAG: hypothetical protein AAF596_06340 [Planctomycetota bacterium]